MDVEAQPRKRWQIKPKISAAAAHELRNYNPILAQLLFNRSIESAAAAAAFLDADAPQSDDPMLLQDMEAAVDRIARAVQAGEHIAVYGDYDVDGVTSSALLAQLFESYGVQVSVHIPHRFDEGYGLNNASLEKLKSAGVSLVVTVDCGIRAIGEAAHARKLGLDLIVTDHHHLGAELPPALAVIDPKREDDPYPEKMLAGVGLAYKLAQALLRRMPSATDITEESLLDLVALGTVADLAPLQGENRLLVQRGLAVLNRTRREGLKSLIRIARLTFGSLKASSIGFQLGPRLNAAGRIDSAWVAYNLLTTQRETDAERLADKLERHNRERRQLTADISAHARELALNTHGADEEPFLLFAAHESFNAGVVGLAASRLADEFYRPAFVAEIRTGSDRTVGSARSIPEFNVTAALDACSDTLVRYGGHAAAAGFTVINARRDELAQQLQQIAAAELAGADLRPTLLIDLQVEFKDLSFDLAGDLGQLEPCGYGNPTPVFVARDVQILSQRTVGRDGKHLKMSVQDGSGSPLDAIAFGFGERAHTLPRRVDVVFELEINEWQGLRSLQLNVKDLAPAI